MKQQAIYELSIISIGTLNEIRQKEPFTVFFSNLSKTIETLMLHLGTNGWETKRVNYTAVYRSMLEKGKFGIDYDFEGAKMFRVQITKRVLNPIITSLGIEEKPKARKVK